MFAEVIMKIKLARSFWDTGYIPGRLH